MQPYDFFTWLENDRSRYGGDPGDMSPGSMDKTSSGGYGMMDRMSDNDIAEGDWEEELTNLVMAWAGATGVAKTVLKQRVDDYTEKLLAMGNSLERVMSILNRATHGGRGKGSFIGRARNSAAA